MKKSIFNIGKALDKNTQKKINGGFGNNCPTIDFLCDDNTGAGCCEYVFLDNACVLVCPE